MFINELPYIQFHFYMKSFLFDREIGVIAFIFFSSFAYSLSLSLSLYFPINKRFIFYHVLLFSAICKRDHPENF